MQDKPASAQELERLPHCSGCGAQNPTYDDDGDTTCCVKRVCPGGEIRMEEPCCATVATLREQEAEGDTPPDDDLAEVIADVLASDPGQGHDDVPPRPAKKAKKKGGKKGKKVAAPAAPVPQPEPPATPEQPKAVTPPKKTAKKTPAKKTAPAPRSSGSKYRRPLGTALPVEGWFSYYPKDREDCDVAAWGPGDEVKYALYCRKHQHIHPLGRLTQERTIRAARKWCPGCTSAGSVPAPAKKKAPAPKGQKTPPAPAPTSPKPVVTSTPPAKGKKDKKKGGKKNKKGADG